MQSALHRSNSRTKRVCELTSSMVPGGTALKIFSYPQAKSADYPISYVGRCCLP